MYIGNLKRANQIAKEISELNLAKEIVTKNCSVTITSNQTTAVINSRAALLKISEAIDDQIHQLEIEVQSL